MKKILLGTTALVAAAGFSGIASAQQVTTKATSLSIAGSVEFEAAYTDSDATTATRKVDFLSDGDFTFSPKYVADNGLTTTGRIDFGWGSTSTMATDELSITFQSASFGAVTLGDDDGAADSFWQGGPTAGDGNWDGSAPNFAVNTTQGTGIGWSGDNLNVNTANGDAAKIYYYTTGLDLSGFTFGASYTPKSGDTYDSADLTKASGSFSDIYDVGGSWAGNVSGVSLTLAGSYSAGKRDYSTDNYAAYNVGGKVGFGALTVGGGYTHGSNRYTAGADDTAWAAGATYAIGAFTVGATYQKSDFDDGTASKADSTAYGGAVTYAIAPGVSALAEINQFKNDETDDKATVVMAGTKIAF